MQSAVRGVRCFTGGFLLGGSLGYVAVWESDDGGEGESMKSVEEEYRLSTAAKAGSNCWRSILASSIAPPLVHVGIPLMIHYISHSS